jgi:hypothetical protein
VKNWSTEKVQLGLQNAENEQARLRALQESGKSTFERHMLLDELVRVTAAYRMELRSRGCRDDRGCGETPCVCQVQS